MKWKWLRVRMVRNTIGLVCLVTLLLVADRLCYRFTLPVALDEQHGQMTLHVGSTVLPLKRVGTPVSLQFVPASDVVHEYQLDGSDSTNNFTLDQTYLEQIASTPYYRFQAWMRDLDGASSWRDLRVRDTTRVVTAIAQPDGGLLVNLPASQVWHLDLRLQRPETPRTLIVQMADDSQLSITLDRNDRYIQVVQSASGQDDVQVASAFFPTDVLPFAAMVLDFLLRTVLWAIIVLLVILICEFLLAVIGSSRVRRYRPGQWSGKARFTVPDMMQGGANRASVRGVELWLRKACARLCAAIHPLALLALCASCCFVAWIARVQYNAEPHIYDAVAYFFAAKMYALGHLSVPVPLASDRFPGPFMVQYDGRWFAQYPPGTALSLVPGIWLGLPWLVEPVLGTLALLGIGLVAARLYDRRVATLAVILGTLSPFYSYLAASYLSHAVALFYLVWGMWASVRFFQGGRSWNLALAAGLFGMGALTRDQIGWLFAFCVLIGFVVLSWRRLRSSWRHYLLSGFLFVAVLLLFVAASLCFNTLLTDSPWVTPRTLFSSGDHWGFGQGIGFYGQHTVAAGLVNLDEQLTALAIDLYGWPFY
ncbi:MAG TPA: glycosyltransferase family 39 protein, partial [Ktedonobacteraceae bacterium]|nr:glycosyltransferase family 39 protein [Ktedonobacteraceae bacterium]